MAKDYFQDITPPSSPDPRANRGRSAGSSAPPPPPPETYDEAPRASGAAAQGGEEPAEKSIRNINITPSRRARIDAEGPREGGAPPRPRGRGGSRYMLWGGVAFALLVLVAIGFVALRPTTVTAVPRSHIILFDETAHFTAYPAQGAATGTLSFTIQEHVFEDSQVVPAQGTERVEARASGAITVYNEYSSERVVLIKNTRFETTDGLVFRVPAEVVVPGKRGSTPGEMEVTVFADEPGEKYNIGATDKFTLPGLRSTSAMYTKVYARSSSAMTGGFVGNRPAANPADTEAAQAEIRNRLEEKIRAFAHEMSNETTFAFPDLARVTFESLPSTAEEDGKARIAERAHIELPLFSAENFAYIIGESVSAAAERGTVTLRVGEGFAARPEGPQETSLKSSPLSFTLEGKAQLVWKVDTQELAQALAGRDEVAFQAIVEGFPGIEEAYARIEPFWKRTFPADPSAIKVKVQEPAPAT